MIRTAPLLAGIRSVDTATDKAFDHIRGNPVADRIFYGASTAGEFSSIWLALAAVRGVRGDTASAVRIAVGIAVESAIVNLGIKSLFRRKRPVFEGVRPHRFRQPRTTSFPSGHSTSSFFAASLLAASDPALSPLYYGLAGVVAASRVYVRIHHASDVVAGAALGLIAGHAVRMALPLESIQPEEG